MSHLSRRARIAVIIGAVFVGAIFVMALVSELVFHQSIDPTEQSFGVTIRNDSAQDVVVKQCDRDCATIHDHFQLHPGSTETVNASDDASVTNWYLVADSTGQRLGCLPLRFDHKQSGVVINVSSAGSCP